MFLEPAGFSRAEYVSKGVFGATSLHVAVWKGHTNVVEELLQDASIIRNRAKIEATINNAKRFIEIQGEFGTFDKYIWEFVGGKPIINQWKSMSEVPVTTPESDALSKDLKKRGFKFLGSTTIYAHMQAIGLVNDHTVDCFRHREV